MNPAEYQVSQLKTSKQPIGQKVVANYYLVSVVNYDLISLMLSNFFFFFPQTHFFPANALARGNFLMESHSRKGSESCVKLFLETDWQESKLLCPLQNRNVLDFFQWITLIILQFRMAIEPLQGLYPGVKTSFVPSHELKKNESHRKKPNQTNQKTLQKKHISCASLTCSLVSAANSLVEGIG